jgi:polyferredoxin
MVGSFLLIYLGIIQMENLQIEWVWFSLLAGLTGAALIHYLIAKIIGPLVIGRMYCGWACYTLMLLDLLPWKNSPGRLKGPWGWLRLAHLLLSLALVLALWFVFDYRSDIYMNSVVGVYWFIGGNLLYYTVGVALAVVLKDNRAFCKYVCPVTIFLKPGTCLSMLKISGDRDRCTACGTCADNCPMDIEVYKYIQNGQRVLSTECTSCQTCVTVCPNEVLSTSFGLDLGGKEHLRLREHA